MTPGGPGEGGSEVLSVGGSCASEGTAGRRGGQERVWGQEQTPAEEFRLKPAGEVIYL